MIWSARMIMRFMLRRRLHGMSKQCEGQLIPQGPLEISQYGPFERRSLLNLLDNVIRATRTQLASPRGPKLVSPVPLSIW